MSIRIQLQIISLSKAENKLFQFQKKHWIDLHTPEITSEHYYRIILPKEFFFFFFTFTNLETWKTSGPFHPASHHLSYKSQLRKLLSHICSRATMHTLDSYKNMDSLHTTTSPPHLTWFWIQVSCEYMWLAKSKCIWKVTYKGNMKNIHFSLLAPTLQESSLDGGWNNIEWTNILHLLYLITTFFHLSCLGIIVFEAEELSFTDTRKSSLIISLNISSFSIFSILSLWNCS